MISEDQFLIGHLSPKLFNHLGFNEIYHDPRQNFYLCRLWISWLLCQAPLQGLIPYGSLSTTDTFSSITHYSYYQEVSRYSSWLHYGLHITPHRINSNCDVQFLAHFLGNPLQSSPVTKLIRSLAYHPGTGGQTEKWTKS